MSPLWRDQIRIVLSPRQVAMARLARGWTPRITRKCVIPCATATPNEAPWRHALTAIDTALQEFGEHKADTVIVLSNHFVRYALVEHCDQLHTEEEELALVRHCFSIIYGDSAERWVLRLNAAGIHDATRIASAVDRDFHDALRERFKTTKFRLRSIQPYLMTAFNQWRHRFNGAAWLVLGEPGRLCLAKFHGHQCYSIKTMRIGNEWPLELATCLEREKRLSGFDTAASAAEVPVFVFAPGYAETSPPQERELWP